MSFSKNHRIPVAARPYTLKVLYIFAAVMCWLWAVPLYLTRPEMWPLPGGTRLYLWWPMYACFGVISLFGLYCRWGCVLPCFLFGVVYGNLCMGYILPAPVNSTAVATVLNEAVKMFVSSILGVTLGVWLDGLSPKKGKARRVSSKTDPML